MPPSDAEPPARLRRSLASPAAVRSDARSGGETPAASFAELRSLLVGPEQRQLRALQNRLDDPAAQAREISRVLPQAVELRTNDPHLTRALAPTIEEAISASVRRNPHPLADALFPVIGPAIRKAIAATLSGMVESLNTTLEHSLSWRSLRWRLDARRTGKPFAEIVLLNTLVYRVEQVFLIHRSSGLLLQHVKAGPATVQDADMISSMLTAIRDFVQDSFQVSRDDSLQRLQVGDLSVWIEQGPDAVLAAVVRGTPPADLHTTLQQTLESVHAQYSDPLASFDGDATRFEGTRPLLESCLQAQYRTREGRQRRSPVLWVVTAGVAIGIAFWLLVALQSRSRWNGYLEALRGEPGLVVVSTGRAGGRYVVNGLRDPLAPDPRTLLAAHALRPDQVDGRWQLYQALDPSLVLARARNVLRPPSTVTLGFTDGVLVAKGSADVNWIDSSVRLAPALAGVTRFDAENVIDEAVRALAQRIEAAAPLFVKGTATFGLGGEAILREQIARIGMLDALGKASGRRFRIELVGQADADGDPSANQPLSEQRANRVRDSLQSRAFEHVELTASGIGSRGADPNSPETEKQRNRRVAFHVSSAASSSPAESAR